MEESKNPATPVDAAQQHPAGEGEHRPRRRGHRGGKKHKHRAENAANQERSQQPKDAQKSSEGKAPQQTQKPAQQAGANGGQKGGNDKKNNRRDKRQDRRQGSQRRDHIAQKDDIYGDPKEEKELAEWRAKIVLNAQPAGKPLAPFPNDPVEDTEAVELPEGIDLFESPILTPPKKAVEEQVEVIGIRFRSVGKMYYFDPRGHKLKKGDCAIVETARGPEFGDVCMGNSMINASETVSPLRPLLRVATKEDIERNEANREKEKEALAICQKKIVEHKLDMKLIEVQYAFDNSKLLFYFSSEGRVDFRDLVKDLASVFRTRIELRQIGIRDEAKMLGGLGACGRMLCCSTFLPDFAQVSIKMAKEQGLSLNSAKISGMCGRLMCCLRFESEVYAAEHRLTPPVNSRVKTEDGIGTVISTNPLAGTVRVIFKDAPDTPPKQYHRDSVTLLPKEKPENRAQDAEKGE